MALYNTITDFEFEIQLDLHMIQIWLEFKLKL